MDARALAALKAVDFQWTTHIDSVWTDLEHDVPSLHEELRTLVVDRLEHMRASSHPSSPLGSVVVGSAGVGKTHLLSSLRKEALGRGLAFVLVDMTDVRDFWSTALLGYLESLQKQDATGRTQSQLLLHHLVSTLPPAANSRLEAEAMTRSHPPRLINQMDELVRALGRIHQREVLRYQDVLRAFVLFCSEDFDFANLGHAWLQGHGLGEEEMLKYGFRWSQKEPREVVQGLSWLMSLRGPTLLALDQLDAIVSEHRHLVELPDEDLEPHSQERISRQIIEGIGHGLMALRDGTRRTLVLVTCIEATWETLQRTALGTTTDRYESPRPLLKVRHSEVAERLVTGRLEAGYRQAHFQPPYRSWPFSRAAFESALGMSPRLLLQRCDQHRRLCLEQRAVVELHSFTGEPGRTPPSPPTEHQRFDGEYATRRDAAIAEVAKLTSEEQLGQLLAGACRLLVTEREVSPDIDVFVDEQFPGQSTTLPPLHARIRLLLNAGSDNERERHFCLRVNEQTHHIAFQARLRAAMTASGIDPRLQFRKLMVVRGQSAPSGAKSTELTTQFTRAGGFFVAFPAEERPKLWALVRMYEKHLTDAGFIAWLQERKPASQLTVLARIVAWLDEGLALSRTALAVSPPPAKNLNQPSVQAVTSTPTATSAPHAPSLLPLGHQVIGDKHGTQRTIAPTILAKHTVILAGSGSGKTVLVRRIVEEAALLGIPSIVIDGANDLARLGDRWPERPPSWTDEDAAKAERYHQTAEAIVWTPGRPSGNPLGLAPLPDLAAVARDSEELGQMVLMTTESLGELVAPGASESSKLRRGVLSGALRYFATHGGGTMKDFVELLKDLPPDAGPNIAKASELATKIADNLLAALETNPLLAHGDDPLDPGVLFGIGAASGRTRISVLNLVGLPGLGMQQQFVNQLAMALFAWLKKHPGTPERPLTGLLVVDEAKDFVPSQSNTPCKASLLRLAAQGRKYGLGLVFATQAPKSIDHNVIANCTTQFFGKANSPAAIEAVQEQLRLRGGNGNDIARLPRGRFYLHTDGMTAPEKLDTPLCLSHHPSNPLDEGEVLERAQAARRRLGR